MQNCISDRKWGGVCAVVSQLTAAGTPSNRINSIIFFLLLVVYSFAFGNNFAQAAIELQQQQPKTDKMNINDDCTCHVFSTATTDDTIFYNYF